MESASESEETECDGNERLLLIVFQDIIDLLVFCVSLSGAEVSSIARFDSISEGFLIMR